MDVPSPERCSRLTAHKVLPKRRTASDEPTPAELGQTRSQRSYTSPTREARITSWIRDASPNLPLTPPDDRGGTEVTMERDGSQADDMPAGRTFYLDQLNERSGSATPVNQHSPPTAATLQPQSPPTPEMTPPKKIRERKRSPSPPLRRRKRTSLSPPPTSRQTSSKAESFRTAAEQLSSPRPQTAEPGPPLLAFQSPSPANDHSSRSHNTDSIGLGIGMTEDDSVCTPTNNRRTTFSDPADIIERVFTAKEITPELVDSDPMVASETLAVTALARRSGLLRSALDDETYQGFSYIIDDDTPYKERPFFDQTHHLENGLAQSDLSSTRSVSPLSEQPDADDALLNQARRDSKRVSQISQLSMPQSVEVMVIDSPPKERQTLRHASKNASLRAASSQGDSNRSSLQSTNDYKPRLNGMLGNVGNVTANSSLHSDSGISMVGSDHIMKRWSKLAATDIPRRQPSMTSSLNHASSPKYNSANMPRAGDRPATAPSGHDDPPGLRSMKKRTISTSSSSTQDRSRGRTRQLGSMLPPHIPKRTSSLGATNREASGPSSTTSQIDPGSSKHKAAHGRSVSQPMPQAQMPSAQAVVITGAAPEQCTPRTAEEPVLQHARQISHQSTSTSQQPLTPVITLSPTEADGATSPRRPLWLRRSSEASEANPLTTPNLMPHRNSKEDAALLASRALIKTPFSGHSVQSGFSGTYEVHEATAINIYPHTNSSLLVIQQATPTGVIFPVHPGVRPGAYRVTEISSPTSTVRARQPESMHVKIEGPDSSPSQDAEAFADSPTLPYDSPLRHPRPAPKAPVSESGSPPSVNLIPPTPLDIPIAGDGRGPNNKATAITGPLSRVRRALSSGTRTPAGGLQSTSGNWLASGRARDNGGVKKTGSRSVIKDESLSPFWRPKRFWDDEDGHVDELDRSARSGPSSSSNARPKTAAPAFRSRGTNDDYFSRPVRNTLGFPQSRLVISGPASLVRRLSSIRRYRSLKRKKFPPATQPVRPLSPSSLSRGAARVSSVQRRSWLPGGKSSVSPVRVMSPTPSAMARRRRRQKRKVRFEFNPMRGLSGSSGESPGWATRAMRRRSEKKAEKRRQQLKGNIGQPRLETVLE